MSKQIGKCCSFAAFLGNAVNYLCQLFVVLEALMKGKKCEYAASLMDHSKMVYETDASGGRRVGYELL